jgi:hypothetical protein
MTGGVSPGEVKECFAQTQNSIFKEQNNSRHNFATSPRNAPEPLKNLPPPKRAWGMPDAR